MTRAFLFGPLAQPAHLALVVPGLLGVSYKTHGMSVHATPSGADAVLVKDDTGQADGIDVDLNDDQLLRLQKYALGQGAEEAVVELPNGAAIIWSLPASASSGQSWDASTWWRDHAAISAEMVADIFGWSEFGDVPPTPAQSGMMRSRASARVAARTQPAPASESGLTASDTDEVEIRRPYTNFFAVQEADLRVPTYSGDMGEQRSLAALVATDASIVLPYDPAQDRVLLIEQFRAGPFFRGDPNSWLLEPVAGRIDPNETAIETAHREGAEEADLKFRELIKVHSGYASPGCSTEYFHIFVGLTDLPDDAAKVSGLDTEHEDIKGYILPFDVFIKNLMSGEYPVTPLATAGFWLALNRDGLRLA